MLKFSEDRPAADSSQNRSLDFTRDGAKYFPSILDEIALQGLETVLADAAPDRAGVRLHRVPGLEVFLNTSGPIGKVAASAIGEACWPVRAVLFDKSPTTNWALGWHQDRTIVVKQKVDVDGFGPWTTKDGLLHVAPPFELLASMVTLRVHLDPVPATNAPLLIACGSHRLGRIAEPKVLETVQSCGVHACLADAGDVWLYSTPILHASEAAATPVHRRVLQIDYAVGELPGGLEWLGV